MEVPVEKLLPEIFGGLGKENPSKRRCKISACMPCLAAMNRSVSAVQYAYVYTCSLELCVQDTTAVCTRPKYCVTSQHFSRPLGYLPGFEYRRISHMTILVRVPLKVSLPLLLCTVL